MIYDTLIWTKRGWLKSDELIIGDTVISYNPQRNCTEYDKVSHIHIGYGITPIMGLKSHSINLSITPDHPFLIRSSEKKTLERRSMQEVFLSSFKDKKTVLYSAPFEPYLISNDLDDVAWSARIASSFSNTRYMPIEYAKIIWDTMRECRGIEAQHWIETFYHWNKLLPRTYWSKAANLDNVQVREIMFNIAPRAGFGIKLTRNPKVSGKKWIIGLSTQNAPQIRNIHWYRDRVEGFTFNIKTRNGNFLASKAFGTFLCPCDLT